MSFDIPHDILALQITPNDLRTVPKPVISNVVVTFSFGNRCIDTDLLTTRMPGLAFNPQNFAAIKIRGQRAMALGFVSGEGVSPGARSIEDARLYVLRFIRLYLDDGQLVHYNNFHVENIVCTVWAPFEIDIDAIKAAYSIFIEYTNDKFPGLIFRMRNSKIVFNIFVSGRVIIAGSHNYDHSIKYWWWLYTNVLTRYQRGSVTRSTNSARYKRELHQHDKLTEQCNIISSRFARREDGPLANSQYGSMINTPRGTPMHMPTTPLHISRSTSPTRHLHTAPQPQTSMVTIIMDRMASLFVGHAIHCPYVTTQDTSIWTQDSLQFDVALAHIDNDETQLSTLTELIQPHITHGCVHANVLRSTPEIIAYARKCQIQLTTATTTSSTDGEEHTENHDTPIETQDHVNVPSIFTVDADQIAHYSQMSIDDVYDYESQHRLDRLRASMQYLLETNTQQEQHQILNTPLPV